MILKKILILLFLLASSTSTLLFAQEWAPNGAKWYYSTSGTAGGGGILTIEAQEDTVIDGLTCRKLEFLDIRQQALDPSTYVWDTTKTLEFFHYDSDSISHYDRTNSYFYKLYDFTLEQGDTVIVRNENFPGELPYIKFEYVVDSVVQRNVNDYNLNYIYIKAINSSDWTFTSQFLDKHAIIENIGSSVSFLGISEEILSLDWGSQYFLRCYSDENIDFHFELFPSDVDCDYLPTSLNSVSTYETSIYPNPVSDYLWIKDICNQNITIYNSVGQIVFLGEFNGSNYINTKNWDSGPYFIRITTGKNEIFTKTIIKI